MEQGETAGEETGQQGGCGSDGLAHGWSSGGGKGEALPLVRGGAARDGVGEGNGERAAGVTCAGVGAAPVGSGTWRRTA
ncbi:hypothetical protein Slala02_53980 [Streptomyces lavendulae subsp. lavendulae]|nr:hypothetical protein Slala01_07150 [Streptomyces lavendulae subsp. lavendulae]GLX29578.1 hypothetical protein Slala02_53980 [Streptomyces lavendulae subsp. lavendulae]